MSLTDLVDPVELDKFLFEKNKAALIECDGYKKLLADVENDEKVAANFHNYREKLEWVILRAHHYSEMLHIPICDLLNAWEERRNYWYMNYYQDCNFPRINSSFVRVFDTADDFSDSIDRGKEGFRCPNCGGISTSPTTCDSGKPMDKKGNTCDWKSWGLLGTLGKGVFVYVKEQLRGQHIFMPVAWEGSK